MASNESAQKLRDLFDEAYKLYENLTYGSVGLDSGSKIQENVKKAIHLLEEATRLVSALGVFSSNESVEEVATEDLRYFLLPAVLGCLNLRATWVERIEAVEVADIYLRDFLKRCKEYGLTEAKIPEPSDKTEDERGRGGQPDLHALARDREDKIRRYKEQKEIELELALMKDAVANDKADDEVKRKYYTSLVKKFINVSLDELKSLDLEKPILLHMAKLKKDKVNSKPDKPEKPVRKPLQTVIITKNELQKKVYGLGYPSIPTFTVNEFYDQRVKEGWFPPGGTAQASLQDLTDEDKVKEKEETEEQQKEIEEEQDDPERLGRARAFDEYKDDHKRGEGNRMNRS